MNFSTAHPDSKRSYALTKSVVSPAIALALLITSAAAAQAPANQSELQQLHATLQSDATRLQKIEACKRIAAIGGPESVPVLTRLLGDDDLAHAARIGLEAIPAPAAGAALVAAIPDAEGLVLVGIINSLAARREASAVPELGELVGSSNTQVASTAAFALGRIATDEAIDVLAKAIPAVSDAVRPAVGKGCLIAIDQCRRDGRTKGAAVLCDQLMHSQMPEHIRLAAIRGALLAQDPIDRDYLITLVRGKNEQAFSMALTVIRECSGSEIIPLVAGELEQLPAARQRLIVKALGDRGDETALPVVLSAAQSSDDQLRSTAIRCLANFPYQPAGPKLLDAALAPEDRGRRAAISALVAMPRTALDEAILQRLDGADADSRIVLYELIGRRHIQAGLSALRQGVEAEQLRERIAAIQALGATIPAAELDLLTTRLSADLPDDELDAVRGALTTACTRLGDAETCAQKIISCLPETTATMRHELYNLLGLIGGPTALEAVAKAARGPVTPEMQDTVTRVLGEWMSPDAAPLLLELARSEYEEKYRIRALRGYIRILRQFDMTGRQRIDMCQQAMPLAERKEERLLMLEALLRVPAKETLMLAVTQLDNPEVNRRACEVSLWLGNAVCDRYPETVLQAMHKILAATDNADFKNYARQLIAKAKQHEK